MDECDHCPGKAAIGIFEGEQLCADCRNEDLDRELDAWHNEWERDNFGDN